MRSIGEIIASTPSRVSPSEEVERKTMRGFGRVALSLPRATILKLSAVFALIYFFSPNGLASLPALTVSFLLKDVLKMTAEQASYFGALTIVGWAIKPLWGIISDAFPLFGFRRISYLAATSLGAASVWTVLGFINDYSVAQLLILFSLSSVFYSFMDVLCDALMVETGRPYKLTGRFQSVQWTAVYGASILTGLAGGYVAAHWEPQSVFMLNAAFPLIILCAVLLWVREKKNVASPSPLARGVPRQHVGGGVFKGDTLRPDKNRSTSLSKEETPSVSEDADTSLIREETPSVTADGDTSLIREDGGRDEMRERLEIVKKKFTEKQTWLLAFFIFFVAFSPSFGAPFFYYSVDTLKFTPLFLGAVGSIAAAAAALGAMLFGKVYTRFSTRQIVKVLLIFFTLATLFDLIYFLPYVTTHLSFARYLYGATGALNGFLGAVVFLAILNSAALAAPKGAEGTTFATLTAFWNIGTMGAAALGGYLFSQVGLPPLIVVSAVFTALALAFLPKLRFADDRFARA